VVHHALRRRACLAALSLALAQPLAGAGENGMPAAIEQVKPSIVAVGTFERLRNPQFSFSGTGFAVGDGSRVATNAHVVAKVLDTGRNETLAIAVRGAAGSVQVRAARKLAADTAHDLALLAFDGPPLPALRLGNSAAVREGEMYLFTGYPIGAVLGLFPVTHRTMISALTPIVIPAAGSDKLDARSIRRLAKGAYPVFQLDGTAYPGNSGSPVYRPETGEVIGIVNSVFVKGTKESALTQPSGITYAIPAQKLTELLQRRP
jgi:hypothetical protein